MRKFFTRLFPISGLLSAGLVLALAGPLAAAVTITTPATATLTTGTQQYPLSATGGTGVYTWSVASGTLPAGLALRTDIPSFFNPTSQQAGLIGVATTPGTYNFTVSLTSGADTASLAMTVKITAFNITNGGGLPDAFVGNAYSYTFASINSAGAVTYSVAPGSSLPTGLTLSPGGVLSGTPTVPGNANFAVSANDGTDTVTTGVNVTVSAINITTPAILPNGTQNSSYTQALSATGGTGAITWSVHGGLPNGLSIVGSSITGTINQGAGTYYFTLNASDTVSTFASKQMSITVLGTTPQLLGISPNPNLDSATVGDRYSVGFTVCCGGVGPFSWSVTGLPAGMSFRFAIGTTSPYISAGAVELFGIPQAVGNFTINLTATGADGQSATLPVSFRVSALNVNSPAAGTLGVAYNQALRVLGGTAPYSATLAPGSQPLPAGLSLTATPPTLTGTPAENGSFIPAFTISDAGANTLTRHLSIFINNVAGSTGVFINDGSDLGYTPRNTPFSRTLSASGTGPFTWSVVSGSLPSGLSLSTSGTISGTPTAAGTFTFLIQVTDSTAKTAFRQFRLVVTGLTITTFNPLPFGNAATAYTIPAFTATGGSGAQTWALAPGSVLPPGMTLSGAGLLGGTPTATGQYNFTVHVTDTAANLGIANFNLSIYPTGSAPPVVISTAASLGQFRLGTNQIQLVATGGNGTYTWSLTSGTLPPGLSIRAAVCPEVLPSAPPVS